MAYKPTFAQKGDSISAPRVDIYTDVGGTNGFYCNSVSVFGTTGTVTGTPTVDSGAVSTYATRGAAATNATITWKADPVVSGVPTLVKIHIPKIQLLTFTGTPAIFYPVGVSNVLPAAIRPFAAVSRAIDGINNTAAVVARITISTGGVISLTITAATAVTGAFGLANDLDLDYLIVTV